MAFNENLNPYISKIREHPGVTWDLDEVFKSLEGKRCLVDLGCGNGHFLQSYLGMNPDLQGVGVERRFKRTFKTAKKLEAHEAKVINYDVFDFLRASPSCFFDEVWVQFPDPWPKLRHAKNRMISSRLFLEVYRVLKDGGRFCFRSDHFDYWEFLQLENNRTRLFGIMKARQGDLFSDLPTTLFQRKFMMRGVPIYSCELRALKSTNDLVIPQLDTGPFSFLI